MMPNPPFNDLLSQLQDADSATINAVVEQLRQDHRLLQALVHHARAQGTVPEVLYDLLLECLGADLVRRYRQCPDLESGLWLLPQLERPGVDVASAGRAQLDALAERHQGSDPATLAHILGTDYGFTGDRSNYHHPHNCFLDRVLTRRLGMPITLVCLWLLLCRRQQWPVRAIALPGHVFGAWDGGYVDCFAGGQSITQEDLDRVARNAGVQDASSYLDGASDSQLLQRLALNLAVGYRQRGDALRALFATAMARERRLQLPPSTPE